MLSPSKRRLAMMFSQMTNDDLMVKFHECVRSERKIAHHVLEYIAEIETRQLYLGRGYPSLHAFLREAFGYSEGAATRRIAGARLLRQIPDIATKLEAGTINLSQLVQIQATCRESEKQNRQAVTVEQKRQILAKVESATSAQTQVIAAESLGVTPVIVHQQQHHADRSVTITMTFTKEQLEILKRAQELCSHEVAGRNWAEAVVCFAKKAIAQKTEIRRASPRQAPPIADHVRGDVRNEVRGEVRGDLPNEIRDSSRNTNQDRSRDRGDGPQDIAPKFREKKPRSIRPNDRKQLLADGQCEYRDPVTQKMCGSRYFAQVDHVQPVSQGGQAHLANLRILCAAHNRYVYANRQPPLRSQQQAQMFRPTTDGLAAPR